MLDPAFTLGHRLVAQKRKPTPPRKWVSSVVFAFIVILVGSAFADRPSSLETALHRLAWYERMATVDVSHRTERARKELPNLRREANELLEKQLRSNPKDYKAYYFLAYLREYNDDHERYDRGFDLTTARQLYEKSISLKEDYSSSHLNLGWLLRLSGQTNEAIRHLERAQELDPRNSLAAADLAFAYLDKGMADRARQIFDDFARRIGNMPESARFKTFEELLAAYRPPALD